MISSKYRWDMPEVNTEQVKLLSDSLKMGPLAAGVLAARGWTSPEETAVFLKPEDEGQLLDPYQMKGMRAAADCILNAIAEGAKIRVYGDYDADGVTSVALMIRLLTLLKANFDTYIPHRSKEGYGLHLKAIDLAAEAGVALIITVDNGISAVEQVAYAKERGISVVVTDHHEPPDILPEAIALVNPKQKDCSYPYKDLCGAGVVFKLAHALLGRPVIEFADLAAIGTVADLMPLTGENRVIVSMGLELMRRQPIAGIRALSKATGFEPKELSSGRLGFSIAPRLNAAGRIAHADQAVQLLTATKNDTADVLASALNELNLERQECVDATVIEADAIWQQHCSRADSQRKAIVLAKAGWNAGIAGLVASKLVERYYRPVIILAIDPESGWAKGSARSIDGFDLYAALTDCKDLLLHYGGHQAAAGMTIHQDRIEELADRLHALAELRISPEDWQPKRRVDISIPLSDISLQSIDELKRLEPFGNGNPTPRILIPNVVIRESRLMGKENQHLRITVECEGRTMEAVGFSMGSHQKRFAAGYRVDLLCELSINEWNGNRKVQIIIQDYRSEQLHIRDQRKQRNWWAAVESLVRDEEQHTLIYCSTTQLYAEATAKLVHCRIPIHLYSQDGIASLTQLEAAAERELSPVPSGQPWRDLILIGLPRSPSELTQLKHRIAKDQGVERVHIFTEYEASRNEKEREFPNRQDFAAVYTLLRKKREWMDVPGGYVQEIALSLNWPLSTLRMMLEVFVELGFITSTGSLFRIVSHPAKQELEHSDRYLKAKAQYEPTDLSGMTTEQLIAWFNDSHVNG